MNKAIGGDEIPVEPFQILKDDAVKVLHSIRQQIWKTQQWPQDCKRSVFIPIPKKGNAKECSKYHTTVLISHASKVSVQNPPSQDSTVHEPRWILKSLRNQRSNCQHPLDHRKSKRVPEKYLFLLYWLCHSLCVDHHKLWKIIKEVGKQAT